MFKEHAIEKIHNSNCYGTFCEIGAGQPISQRLFQVEGASKTICLSISPYNKISQSKFHNADRSVSYQMVKETMESIRQQQLEEENLIVVTSFCLYKEKSSHGWIGVSFEKGAVIRFYHITLPRGSRSDIIEHIGDIGIDILLRNPCQSRTSMPFDIVLDQNGNNVLEEIYLQDNERTIIAFDHQSGECVRAEDVFRKSLTQINIFKGSFNPLHDGHLAIAQYGKEKLGCNTIFMISIDTLEKERVKQIADIWPRIKEILDAGYDVIVVKSGLFYNNFRLLSSRCECKIRFLTGADTINRLIEYHKPMQDFFLKYGRTSFCILGRPGIELSEDTLKLIDRSSRAGPWQSELYKTVFIADDFKEKDISSTQLRQKHCQTKDSYNILNSFKIKQQRKWNTLYWCIDFHDTICPADYGKDIPYSFYPHAKEVLQDLTQLRDVKLILFTCSYPDDIHKILEWLDKFNIRFDFVNENPECKSNILSDFSKKIYFNLLIDDKAGFVGKTDWIKVKNILNVIYPKES